MAKKLPLNKVRKSINPQGDRPTSIPKCKFAGCNRPTLHYTGRCAQCRRVIEKLSTLHE